jgi:hypothetical protein
LPVPTGGPQGGTRDDARASASSDGATWRDVTEDW